MTHPRQKKGVGSGGWAIVLGLGVGEEWIGGASFAAFAEAVGVTADVDDGGLVEEAVEGGAGHDGVAGEDVGPVGEGLVGGQHDGATGVVTLGDDLEEQRGLCLVEGEIADLVEDEQLGAGKVLQLAVQPVLGQGEGELAGGFYGADKVNPVAEFGAGDPEADGQVGLADTGRPEEDDVTGKRTGSGLGVWG